MVLNLFWPVKIFEAEAVECLHFEHLSLFDYSVVTVVR